MEKFPLFQNRNDEAFSLTMHAPRLGRIFLAAVEKKYLGH
jgi:hypothetical protein